MAEQRFYAYVCRIHAINYEHTLYVYKSANVPNILAAPSGDMTPK